MASGNVGLTVVIPVLGGIITLLMFMSPLRAAYQAVQREKLQSLNVIPFVFIIYNCAGWVGYSFQIQDWYVFAPNAFGFMCGITLFTNTALLGVPNKRLRLFIWALAFVFGFWLLLFTTLDRMVFNDAAGRDTSKEMWGWTANIISFLFYASPLTTIYHVLKQRDRSSLVPALCIMNTINGTFWAIYGFAIVDAFVIVPNAAGAIIGAFMVVCCIIFPNREKKQLKEGKEAGNLSGSEEATSSDAVTDGGKLTDVQTHADVSAGGELPNMESSRNESMGVTGSALKVVEEEGNAIANGAPMANTAPGKGTKPEPHHCAERT